MNIAEVISNNAVIIGILLVLGMVFWKFVAQPLMNEGKPIEPEEDQEEGDK